MASALDGCFIKGTSLELAFKMMDERAITEKLMQKLGADAVATLRDDAQKAWVPLSRYCPMCEALQAVLGGEEAYVAFWRDHIQAMLASPLLKGLAATARTLFGLSPAAIFKVTPRGYTLTYKNVGVCESEVEAGRAVLRFSRVPSAAMQTRTFAVGHVGTFGGVVDVFKHKGAARMSTFDPELGRFTIEVTWT
jgi:hypothetical protein